MNNHYLSICMMYKPTIHPSISPPPCRYIHSFILYRFFVYKSQIPFYMLRLRMLFLSSLTNPLPLCTNFHTCIDCINGSKKHSHEIKYMQSLRNSRSMWAIQKREILFWCHSASSSFFHLYSSWIQLSM